MSRTLKIYIGILVLLIFALFLFELNKPKQIDWSRSFNHEHKRPWGTYVLYEELENIFPENMIEHVDETPFQKFRYYFEHGRSSYIFINSDVEFDEWSLKKLLEYANQGNHVFIASMHFNYDLLDTLGLQIDYKYNGLDSISHKFTLTNKTFPESNFEYTLGSNNTFFTDYSDSTLVLGHRISNGESYVNFIKVAFGEGAFYLHTQPYAFTNYYMLKDENAKYVAQVFSYIDDEPIYWDRKYKADLNTSNTPLRYVFSKPSLKWAWRLLWVGLIIFVIFTAKRKQRIIPIIEPLRNTSLDFVKTIGNLYHKQGQPKDIVLIKVNYFLEDVRNKYMLNTELLDEKFIRRLSQKTSIDQSEIQTLVNYILSINNANKITEDTLIKFNKLIEAFYHKAKL